MELIEGESCPFCGQDFETEVYDWNIAERWFLFSTCCEQSYNEFSYQVSCLWDRKRLCAWFMSQTGIAVRGCWVEGESDSMHLPAVLDYGLEMKPVTVAEANAFLEAHHRHNGRVNAFKIGAGIWNGPEMVGLVTVEPPRARALNDRKTLEVTRVCVRSDIEPHQLVANACSMAYGYACREARKLGYQKVITYTRIDEAGGSVKSAGFEKVFTQKRARAWDTPSRPRSEPKSEPVRKHRWERKLVA